MRVIFVFLFLVVCLFAFPGTNRAQHLPDLQYIPAVTKPAYPKTGPRVMFDESHYNYQTLTDRYKPFADLLGEDGYRVIRNRQPFTKKTLETFKVLVIVDALADDIDETGAEKPAFTDDEVNVVKDWVKGGGALLLIADAGPFASAATNLASQFGVEMGGKLVNDRNNCASPVRGDFIVYSIENHLLQSHPITQGRGGDESVKKVISFTGQSLKGAEGSVAFLKLSDSAREISESSTAGGTTTLAGRSQGLALKHGSGRVVVLAEAEMLTALLGDPPDNEPIGMNYPGIDNKQLTLNIMHWLSGLLSEK